ncbi:hypothetical protein ACTFIW_000419 [Dictyostelium discoideum]
MEVDSKSKEIEQHDQWLYCSNCLNGVLEFKHLGFYIDMEGVYLEVLRDSSSIFNNNHFYDHNYRDGADIIDQLPNIDRYHLVSKSSQQQYSNNATTTTTVNDNSYYMFDSRKHDLSVQRPYLMCSHKECYNIIGFYHMNPFKKVFSFRLDHAKTILDFGYDDKPWKFFLNNPIFEKIQVYKNQDIDYYGFNSINKKYNNNNNNFNNNFNNNNNNFNNLFKNNDNDNNSNKFQPRMETKDVHYKPTMLPQEKPIIPKFKEGVEIIPRDYQIESYYQSTQDNTLLVLPTGMGKTLVSIMTLLEMFSINDQDNSCGDSKRIALFLVDRVPLVTQQAGAIEAITNLKVCKLYGEINDSRTRAFVRSKEYDVLVSTVGSLVNLLEVRHLNILDFYFITFDEVHHATGEHDFNKVVDYIRKTDLNYRPRILGLTASLVSIGNSTIDIVQRSIKDMEERMLSRVFKPASLLTNSTQSELQPELISFKTSGQESLIETSICEFLVSNSKELQIFLNYSDVDLDGVRGNPLFLKALERLDKYSKQLESIYIEYTKVLIELYALLSVLSTEGPKQVLTRLDLLMQSTNQENELYNKLLELRYYISGQYDDRESNFEKGSTRYRKLISSLEYAIKDASGGELQKDLRILVFVETRFGASNLTSMLKKEPFQEYLHTKRLVGHNGVDGMDSEKQQSIIKKFRDGKCRLIVTTNVLEEGIDVQDCNIVICYDGILSLKSLIQRRGRARSKNESKFIIIYNDDKDLKILDILSSENLLNNSINQILSNRERQAITKNQFLNWKKLNINNEYFTNNQLLDGGPVDKDIKCVVLSIYHIEVDIETFRELLLFQLPDIVSQVGQVSIGMEGDDEYLSSSIIVILSCIDKEQSISRLKSLLNINGLKYWMIDRSSFHFEDDNDNDNDNINSVYDLFQFKNKSYSIGSFEYGNMSNPTKYHGIGQLDDSFELVYGNREMFFTKKTRFQRYRLNLKLTDIESTFLLVNDKHQNIVHILLIVKRPLIFEEERETTNRVFWNKSKPKKDDFGQAFVYRLTLSTVDNEIKEVIKPLIANGFRMYESSLELNCFIPGGNNKNNNCMIIDLNLQYIKRNLDIHYLLQCLQSQSSYGRVLNQDFIVEINNLLAYGKQEEAEFIITSLISKRTKFINHKEFIGDCLKNFLPDPYYAKKKDLSTKSGEFTMIRDVFITPSRTIFIQPTLQRSCRAVRKFGSSNFIMVKIVNESLEPLQGVNNKHPLHDNRIKPILEGGILVGGKIYSYAGNSNSQLREYSSWFVSNQIGTHTVKIWSGIEHVDNVRKFFRCIGLMFSTTIPTVTLPHNRIYRIQDITRNTHVFTEGCGEIGPELAKHLNENYNFRPSTCAYQVRIGGNKGMLVVNNQAPDPSGIYIRPSMVKFNPIDCGDEHRTLEICSVSTTSRCKLNRQVISLLSTLGTQDNVFFALQDHYLNQVAQIVNDTNASKQAIVEFFPDITEGELYQDPYIRRILISLYKLKMERIQQKCHIEIKDSRMLLGVCDPTNSLPPNTVFVQLEEEDEDDDDGRKYEKVIEGLVMVIKNPCTHPGDVRYLKAVDNTRLRHLRNVLVFSTKGDVPNFKEISGSDLDGDRYFFCYDKSLIGYRSKSETAYLGDETVSNNDKKANVFNDPFALSSMYSTNVERQELGKMYNSHLAISDLFGANHEFSIEISKECFKEIDYPKTGIHGTIPKEANNWLKTKGYPHYMQRENSTRTYYQSKTIMGKMYDQIDQLVYIGDFLPNISLDKSNLVDGYEIYLNSAKILYSQYKLQVHSLLRHYSAESEESIMIGFLDQGFISDKVSKDIKGEMKNDYIKIQQTFENEFLKEFGEQHKENCLLIHRVNIEKKVSAWYHVAYSDLKDDRALGFYWIARSFKQMTLDQESQKKKNILVNSILDHMNKKKDTLFPLYESRLMIVKELTSFLNTLNDTVFKESTLEIIGSTATMLFDENSNLNLYLKLENQNDHSLAEKNEILNQLKDEIKTSSFISAEACSIIKIQGDIPLFKFKIDKIQCLIGLETSKWHETLVQQQYITKNPSILSILFSIIDWSINSLFVDSETGEIINNSKVYSSLNLQKVIVENSTIPNIFNNKNHNNSNNNNNNNKHSVKNLTKSNLFSLLIDFCIINKYIDKCNPNELINTTSNLTIGNWVKLIEIASRYFSVDNNNNNNNNNKGHKRKKNKNLDEYNTNNLGDTILSFFRFYSDSFGRSIYGNEPFIIKLFAKDANEIENHILNPSTESHKTALLFYQESFRHALHSLSTFVSVEEFLSNCLKTTKKIMPIKKNQIKILEQRSVNEEIVKNVQLCGCSIKIDTNVKNPYILIDGKPQQIRLAQNAIRDLLSIKTENYNLATTKRNNKRKNFTLGDFAKK